MSALYPSHLEADVVLRNGRTLRLRPVREEDRERLMAFYARLSPQSLHSRFFDAVSPERAAQYSPSAVDYDREFGVVGEMNGNIIAVAHYFASRRAPRNAEVAFAIADEAQGCGIGTHLLHRLALAARENGIERFTAETLPANQPMLDVFLCSGFDVTSRAADGSVYVSFPIEATEKFADATATRSQQAAHASMQPILAPRAIAVVGASRRPGQLGNEIVRNLRTTGFTGELYVVNPHAVECYARLQDIPGIVDLAIITVPAAHVEAVVDDAIAKHVAAIVVITAGFGETGEEGRAAQTRLLEKVRAAGIRMVGPNCMGVLNTDEGVRMHATFAPVFPPAGNVAMSSQSGALGLAVLDYARLLNIGFSTFISVGNKADVSGNDLVQYWAEDPKTDVILLYLESFGNPRRFGEICRRVGRTKPIVCVKAGRSPAGARAASSHTGALAERDAVVGDLFKQAGIIRTDTLEEMFDVAALLANQPLPRGKRVAILTNAGGPAILAADACEAKGLELAALSPATVDRLQSFLPAAASVKNPVDMIASATADQYRKSLELLLADEAVDSVLVIYIPVAAGDTFPVANAIREGSAQASGKPLLATFMSRSGVPPSLAPVPAFPFPERSVVALARATHYAAWRARPAGRPVKFEDLDVARLRALVADRDGWLEPDEVRELLHATGITIPRTELVTSADAAMAAAMAMGGPVALKVSGPSLLHKTDVGGVRLGLTEPKAVVEAFDDMKTRLGDRMTGAIVQQMVEGGVEVMIGATEDPTFGHIVAYGAGGTLVEVLADVAFRIHPLTDVDATDMIEQARYSKLLHGFRGAPRADVAALRDAILRLSALLQVCPEIRELDVNPLKVREHGIVAVDARVRVAPVVPPPPSRRVTY
jgi:acetyl coenzyme A synthetase (ADP forming)-like protein